MAKQKNTGLGRGLDAIFMDNYAENDEDIKTLRVSEIEPRENQPRKIFNTEALADLASSIAEHGMLQPLIVRRTELGTYQIIAGERRWRAAKMAGITEVPVKVMDLDERTVSEIALIENIQRENLNPVEEANAYKSLIDEYGLTQEELSKKLGKNRSTIANSMRLTELPEETLGMLEKGDLSAGHARALLGIKDRDKTDGAAKLVISKGLSVRQTELLVKQINSAKPEKKEGYAVKDIPEVDYAKELSRTLTRKFGRKIDIIDRKNTKKIEIEFSNTKDLNEIAEKLFGKDIFEER